MENERRDEEFTIVLNRWHMPYRRGAQCAPMSRAIRSAGYHTATQTVYSAQARHICAAQLVYALLWTATTSLI